MMGSCRMNRSLPDKDNEEGKGITGRRKSRSKSRWNFVPSDILHEHLPIDAKSDFCLQV